MCFPLKIFSVIFFLTGVKPEHFPASIESELPEHNPFPTIPACYSKFVSSKGSVQRRVFPNADIYSNVCEWDIDVTRGFVIEFEFEAFKLPFRKEQTCDSYIELSYINQQDGAVKRIFCPTDTVNKVYTNSQTAHLRFNSGTYHEEYGTRQYGFKINYYAVVARKPNAGSNAVTIILLSFASLIILGLCLCYIQGRHKDAVNSQIPSHVVIHQEPNASTQDELQSPFEYQRHLMQAPRNERTYPPFPIFQSRTSSFKSSAAAQESIPNRIAHPFDPLLPDNRKISIASTPRTVLHESKGPWSADNVRRIEHLRTKLVARFSSISSHNSSDIKVYFHDSDRRTYSQLSCGEDQSPDDQPEQTSSSSNSLDKRTSRADSKSRGVPSIVIEFVE